MTVSLSRLTLFPFVLVGSRDRATVPREIDGFSPLLSAPDRADSKSVRPARKPGVLTFAMLSAVTRERSARPGRAAGGAVEVTSPIMRPTGGMSRTRSTSGYAEGTRERVRGPPIRGDVVLSVLFPHRHPGGAAWPLARHRRDVGVAGDRRGGCGQR